MMRSNEQNWKEICEDFGYAYTLSVKYKIHFPWGKLKLERYMTPQQKNDVLNEMRVELGGGNERS